MTRAPGQAKTVLFVGAGASKAVNGPNLEEVIKPVAALALRGYDPGPKRSSSGARLADYLKLVHGVTRDDLAACVAEARGWSPGIVELLTTLDLAIAEDASFGHIRSVALAPPPGPDDDPEPKEFSGNRLRRVHRAIVGAIADGLGVEMNRQPDAPTAAAFAAYEALVEGAASGAIITTNWDSVIDRLLWQVDEQLPHLWGPTSRRVVYTPIAETVVDFQGEPIAWEAHPALARTPLIKLHGSLNWLHCPRCHRLIISPTLDLASNRTPWGDGPSDRHWMDRTCWCEAETEALIVTPSYSKKYGNLQLQAIWREGLEALAKASEWTFVGYSLPSDDFAIRALITRALAWKRAEGLPLTRVRVYGWTSEAEQAAAEAAANAPAPLAPDASETVRNFHALAARYRSILAEFGASLEMSAGGLLAAGREVNATSRAPAQPLAPPDAKAADIAAICKAEWPAGQADCNLFVRAVAKKVGVTLTGDADSILAQIRGSGWTSHKTDGVAASDAAKAGKLVIAGLTAAELGDTHGHVVVVAPPTGPPAHGKYPYAYWGSLNAAIRPDGGKGTTLNYSFNKTARDKVFYASRTI